MWTVSGTLVPVMLLSIYVFGFRALFITLVSIVSCVVVEAISQKALGRKVSVKDGSAVLTGILMAFVIPPGVPYWMPIIGAVPAIFITKELMGGLGFNVWNPALVGRAVLMAAFPVYLTAAWLPPIDWAKSSVGIYLGASVDAVSTATPLAVLKQFGLASSFAAVRRPVRHLRKFLSRIQARLHRRDLGSPNSCRWDFSDRPGNHHVAYSGFYHCHGGRSRWIFGGETWFGGQPLVHVLSGGLMLGAFYMCTDYVTSPSLKSAQIVFGIGIGALTVIIRLKGGYPEGICYAILLMNCLTPALEEWFKPKRFAPPKQAPVAAVK